MLVERNQTLNDYHINFAQAMLRGRFPQCDVLNGYLDSIVLSILSMVQ